MLRSTLKKLLLLGLMGVLALVFSGCIINLLFGFASTSDIDEFQDIVFEGETNVALCKEMVIDGGIFIECIYHFDDSDTASTAELLREFGLLGVFLDPVIIQVHEDAFNFNGTFDDGSGPEPLVITEVSSFFADTLTEVVPESGYNFIIVDFPASVPPTISGTEPLIGDPYSFQLTFTSPTRDLKAMFAGEVQVNGETFYPPMLPCTTDFSTIPEIIIPLDDSPQDLGGQLLTALFNGGFPPCDNQIYDYNSLAQTGPAIDIDKSPDAQTIASGSEATFDITVTNNGDIELLEVQVSDPAAPLCDNLVGSLAVGVEVSYSCSLANVTQDFTNVATVTATEPEGVSGAITDQDSADVTVLVPAEGRTPVGGTAKFLAAPSDPSGPRLGIIVGPVTGIIFALALAAWYARRRWAGRAS